MAKRGIKEPEGSEFIPSGVKESTKKQAPPCWWSTYGHTDPSFGIRAKKTGGKKYQENYDKIKWDD